MYSAIARRLCPLLLTVLLTTSCQPAPPASSEPAPGPAGSAAGSASGQPDTSPVPEQPPGGESPVQDRLSALEALAASKPQPKLTQEDVDQALARVMERYSAAAVSVAAIENGQVTQSGAWGWAVKGQREMTADTKVRVASLSKVAVALCAMAMAEDGLLDLDAPLNTYWGEGVHNPYSQGQPSVRTLLSHSSSVKALEYARGLSNLRSILSRSSSWRNMEPGNGGYWYYSNFAFCVLGTTLELASGQVLDDYLQTRFLQPLGAQGSFYPGNLEQEEIATIYTPSGVGRTAAQQAADLPSYEIGMGATYYPGGLTISAVDMAKLVAILAGDGTYGGVEYLSPESVAAMEQPQFTVDPGETSPFQQCLALRRQEDILDQSVLCYHTGSAYGEFTLLTYNPETGNGVVVLTTGTPRQADERGLYALCADLSAELYARMEDDLL